LSTTPPPAPKTIRANAAAENWEPGIPRVQVNLYRDCNADGIIDKSNCTATTGLNDSPLVTVIADVDNWPFVWSEGGAKGAEDIDRDGDGLFDKGDAVDVGTTDSWDDNIPPAARAISFIPPAACRPIAMTDYATLTRCVRLCSMAAMPSAVRRANRNYRSEPTSSKQLPHLVTCIKKRKTRTSTSVTSTRQVHCYCLRFAWATRISYPPS